MTLAVTPGVTMPLPTSADGQGPVSARTSRAAASASGNARAPAVVVSSSLQGSATAAGVGGSDEFVTFARKQSETYEKLKFMQTHMSWDFYAQKFGEDSAEQAKAVFGKRVEEFGTNAASFAAVVGVAIPVASGASHPSSSTPAGSASSGPTQPVSTGTDATTAGAKDGTPHAQRPSPLGTSAAASPLSAAPKKASGADAALAVLRAAQESVSLTA